MPRFELVTPYPPRGDQPKAIAQLIEGLRKGYQHQTLLGVTGSGKTFTVANIIQDHQKPTLVISHNKTLAAQLCSEFKVFFPHNAVEYFVSYYDYYQPEAYVPQTDTYIAKDASINEEIDRLRHRATQALRTRRDVIIVASVSCIYNLGSPVEYEEATLTLTKGTSKPRDEVLGELVRLQYERNDMELKRGRFRVRGDVIEICTADEEHATRIELFGDTIERIALIDSITGRPMEERSETIIFPKSHYVMPPERIDDAFASIEAELEERLEHFNSQGKILEAQRLRQRTKYDLELIRETGYCPGIENYSRHFDGRKPGDPPYTLLDYFPSDFLMMIDESHVTVPQIGSMYEGDRSRKESLVTHGFRLSSAYDNRPLTFKEFTRFMKRVIYVSATPSQFEASRSTQVVEQIIRPTGLVDPEVIVKPAKNQVDDLAEQIRKRTERKERVLVTTLTKRMAEDLAEYLSELGVKVHYLHSEVATLDRVQLLRELRLGEFDVMVGVNLLREGLDLPEVSLVAILDADKEGYLRSETSLIQTMGRASRNVFGQVILYADETTDSMRKAIEETNRRRDIQLEFNRIHGIVPTSIVKEVRAIIDMLPVTGEGAEEESLSFIGRYSDDKLPLIIANLEEEMRTAAEGLDFEKAAKIRDQIKQLIKHRRAGKARIPKRWRSVAS